MARNYQSKVRAYQNRESKKDTQRKLADDLLRRILPPDHPELKRMKERDGEL